jgi:predicted helicase
VERSPDGIEDKNVFAIKQGVAICLATRGSEESSIKRYELWGMRDSKYDWLAKHTVAQTEFSPLKPDSPYYFFIPQNNANRTEYDNCWKINDVMPVNYPGFITARDHFVVDVDKGDLLERIGNFRNLKSSDAEIRTTYFEGCGSSKYPDGDTRGWKLPMARKRVAEDRQWMERVRRCLYRPFDVRSVYWAPWMIDWPRPDLEPHFEEKNQIAFCITRFNRQQSLGYFFISRAMADFHALDTAGDSMSVFPWKIARTNELTLEVSSSGFNLAPKFTESFANILGLKIAADGLPIGIKAEDIFNYAYALFHSPNYRNRYAEFLKIDFPRLPLTKNLQLFHLLAKLGDELSTTHLLESVKVLKRVTEFIEGRPSKVEKLTWSKNTVWIDKAQTIGFRGVKEDVWNFHIGGYQVCEKWLKDRKGKTLTKSDIEHYHKIVVALSETIRLMAEIDKAIDEHGGWPGALQASK